METFFNRYRNLALLLGVVVAQLLLLAYQIKSNGEVRLIRIWAIGAVTPLARVIEFGRYGTGVWFKDYLMLAGVRGENKRIQAELAQQKLDNQFLRTQLQTADRAKALALFQQQSPSTTTAARVIGNTTGAGARVVIIDRGASSGIEKGMAVITPEGIVGKITGVYPNASYVLLITDASFAAGVMSQKSRTRGTLRGQGDNVPIVDLIANDAKIAPGDWFYTSGDDRIFPKGLPVGEVTSAHPGKFSYQSIQIRASGLANGLEDVLVVLNGVHGSIPDTPPLNQPIRLLPPPPPESSETPAPGDPGGFGTTANSGNNASGSNATNTANNPGGNNGNNANNSPGNNISNNTNNNPSNNTINNTNNNTNNHNDRMLTDADRLLDKYRKIGAASGHVYGESGSAAPNYNVNLNAAPPTADPASAANGRPSSHSIP